jgi:hypothetical protein
VTLYIALNISAGGGSPLWQNHRGKRQPLLFRGCGFTANSSNDRQLAANASAP